MRGSGSHPYRVRAALSRSPRPGRRRGSTSAKQFQPSRGGNSGSNTKGYVGTDHTQGIPEQPEITQDCLISQNGRVHKVFVHMLRRIC